MLQVVGGDSSDNCRRVMGTAGRHQRCNKLFKKHDGPDEIAEIIKTLAKYDDSWLRYEPQLVRAAISKTSI